MQGGGSGGWRAAPSRLVRLVLLLVLVVWCRGTFDHPIPKYTVDEKLLGIARSRAAKCGLSTSSSGEIDVEREQLRLYDSSLEFYMRSHELTAYNYFAGQRQSNAHFSATLDGAELEYIPVLPLHWRKDRAGCAWSDFIQDLLEMHAYLKRRDELASSASTPRPLRFMVATTKNMRTLWGTGMPTQLRKGEAWLRISEFTSSMALGHYERWPECPDLLRKQFKYIVELPYPGLSPPSSLASASGEEKGKVQNGNSFAGLSTQKEKRYTFAFVGNVEMDGPEIACATRTLLYNAATQRNDTLIVPLPDSETRSLSASYVHSHLSAALSQSEWCLVTPGSSYSTAFFFWALHADCLPILINDWSVLPFPFLIPYQTFALRVLQQDFLDHPNAVLDHLKQHLSSSSSQSLRRALVRHLQLYRPLLSYEPVSLASPLYQDMIRLDIYAPPPSSFPSPFSSILPLDLMLLELRYARAPPRGYYNNLPCERFYACEHRRRVPDALYSLSSSHNLSRDYNFYQASDRMYGNRLHCEYVGKHGQDYALSHQLPPLSCPSSSSSLPLKPDSYQIQAIDFPSIFRELGLHSSSASHLCQHHKRLIGTYKMVFFMQCVRLLWPLHPGQFRPVDRVESLNQSQSGAGKGAAKASGISREERDYVLAFHNIQRQPQWTLQVYPPRNVSLPHPLIRRVQDL